MLTGFNTNIRHRGVLFHVQTEDSGQNNPHVITHLFHGGNIMASEKREYADLLGSEGLQARVRSLMEAQHRAMLQRLRRGDYDAGIEARLGAGAWGDAGDGAEALRPRAPEPQVPVAAQAETTEPASVPAASSPPASAGDETPQERLARAFGDGVMGSKPLDEVVLEYLVENARKRKRSSR